ncbi:MAG: glycerol-3-phosphate 1-O-acyltransferase PlsY [Pseudomonadota bacterium]
MDVLLAAILGYLVGSICWGVVLCKLWRAPNPAKMGSGNVGATNVLRTAGKGAAFLTLMLDAFKGGIIAWFCAWFFGHELPGLAAGLMAVIGHVFPFWLGFRGGKGVATTLGVYLCLLPWLGLAACGIWLLVALLFRYSSLAALLALGFTTTLALIGWLAYRDGSAGMMTISPAFAFMSGLLLVLSLIRHWGNIKRLAAGLEPKISFKSKD